LPGRTILLAHHDGAYLEDLVQRFSDAGYEVVGAARTAKMALALAALGRVDMAIVGHKLGGIRDGATLAGALKSTWGVPSQLIERPEPEALMEGLA
jgi:DNA-binding response OmpR family regulator